MNTALNRGSTGAAVPGSDDVQRCVPAVPRPCEAVPGVMPPPARGPFVGPFAQVQGLSWAAASIPK